MKGYFVLAKGKSGKFRFNLKSGNHQTILTSETYESRDGALSGIASVRANAAEASRYERRTAKNGESYFVLKAANEEIIGRSETYVAAANMEKGIASVMANGVSPTMREAT